jgi:Spy/CpxP family protein refolding chaperone
MAPVLILALAVAISLAQPARSQPAPPGPPADAAGRCRYGAEHMIEFAKQSLSEPRARPELTEKRRRQVQEWTSRLERGEDPCAVYRDIYKASNTF